MNVPAGYELFDFVGGKIARNTTTGALLIDLVGADIDIGDIHLLNVANAKVNPATEESLAAVQAGMDLAAARLLSDGRTAAEILVEIEGYLDPGTYGNISSLMAAVLGQDTLSAARLLTDGRTAAEMLAEIESHLDPGSYGNVTSLLAAILEAGQGLVGTGLTFTRVNIDQDTTAGTKVLKAALASNYTRLHRLVGTMSAAGTVQLVDSDGTEIISPMNVAANGQVNIDFGLGKQAPPISIVAKGMSLVSVTGGFNGYGLVSQGTS